MARARNSGAVVRVKQASGLKVVSKSLRKIDNEAIVRGEARYTADMVPPGALYAKVLRSPYARAKITSLDVTKARAVAIDLARRGLAREQAVAIGDSAADVEIADEVALTVIVANSLADARARDAAAGRSNVCAMSQERGAGWAEFAAAWLEARAR